MAYSMARNIYICDLCGFEEEHLDASDDLHGSMWECEDCGTHFCEKCFTDRWGRKAWDTMLRDGRIGSFDTSRIFCPSCFGEILKDCPEKEENA